MMTRTSLPDSITLPCGTQLLPLIGGHVGGKPFTIPGYDTTSNGWLANFPSEADYSRRVIAQAKKLGLKFRQVSVLSRNLRGKLDLRGSPYTGTHWLFIEELP